MKKIAIVGSRRMTSYGKEVIGMLMDKLKSQEIVTIRVAGCNAEVIKLGAKKIFEGQNFEKINNDVADYADVLVVVEGGRKSGTVLLAADFIDKGKLVYCVPGPVTEENSWAPNWLISMGAIPLISSEGLTEDDMIVDNG